MNFEIDELIKMDFVRQLIPYNSRYEKYLNYIIDQHKFMNKSYTCNDIEDYLMSCSGYYFVLSNMTREQILEDLKNDYEYERSREYELFHCSKIGNRIIKFIFQYYQDLLKEYLKKLF